MIGNKWDSLLTTEYNKDYFKNLMDFVKKEYKIKTIYPKQSDVFNAFRYTDFDEVKVVILGQDPYHGPNQAEGLSFSVLTVEEHAPTSHKNHGWETFTDEVIKILNKKTTPVVFIFWGSYARAKKKLITNPIHYVIESAHPSPFSAYNGFFGSKPFSKTNEFLKSKGIKEVNWRVE